MPTYQAGGGVHVQDLPEAGPNLAGGTCITSAAQVPQSDSIFYSMSLLTYCKALHASTCQNTWVVWQQTESGTTPGGCIRLAAPRVGPLVV